MTNSTTATTDTKAADSKAIAIAKVVEEARARLAARKAATENVSPGAVAAAKALKDRKAAGLSTKKEKKVKEPKAKKEKKVKEPKVVKAPAWLRKLEEQKAALPVLDGDVGDAFSLLEAALTETPDAVAGILAHLQYRALSASVLASRTAAATGDEDDAPEVGDRVRIVRGNARWIGKTGEITEARRIRCFVQLDSDPNRKPVYLFTTDVEVMDDDEEDEETETTDEVETTTPAAVDDRGPQPTAENILDIEEEDDSEEADAAVALRLRRVRVRKGVASPRLGDGRKWLSAGVVASDTLNSRLSESYR